MGVLLFFVISTVYAIVLEWRWRGQTLGKRLLGLRVIDAQGLRLQLPQIALRNLLRAVDSLPLFYLVGGTACLVSRYGQRLGDLAANTVVAHERRRQRPDLEQIAPARYNSLLAYPQLAARLRSLASPEAVGDCGAGDFAARWVRPVGTRRVVSRTWRVFPIAGAISGGGGRGADGRAVRAERVARDLWRSDDGRQ